MRQGRAVPPRAFRATRAVLLALSSSALAIAAHAMAGGGLPNTAVTIVLTALVAWAGTAPARLLRGPWATMAMLGASQLSLHVLLTDVADTHGAHAPGVDPGLMLVTHVVATVLTALMLARTDVALGRLAAALAGVVRALVVALPDVEVPTPARPAPVVGHLLSVDFRRALGRRGPPVLS